MGFETATPVQEQAIPHIMKHRDILAVAQTGTGKTAAFLLPTLHHLSVNPTPHIDTLIIEPTRELAIQVDRQLEGFSYFTPVSSVAVYGGRDGNQMEIERKALKKGVNIVVATPGRFISHLNLGYVKLDNVKHIILDEADRMLDMGFFHDIMRIIKLTPKSRQTLLFSATMPQQIRKLSKEILNDPIEISIAVSKPAEGIKQGKFFVHEDDKVRLVERILDKERDLERILIFSGTKKGVRDLTVNLKRSGFAVAAISSDLEQDQRESVLSDFKNKKTPVLVATDVLSRGIDISGIDMVINFDVPGDGEDYVHRIGRTARADTTGTALTLISGRDKRKFSDIEKLMEVNVEELPLPDGFKDPNAPTSRGGSGGGRRSGGGNRGKRPGGNRKGGGGNRRTPK